MEDMLEQESIKHIKGKKVQNSLVSTLQTEVNEPSVVVLL